MNTRDALYGALCGALVFDALSWTVPKRAVHAAIVSAPPEGRFELVQLHPNAGSEWSGILDTETGCVWAYTSQTPPTDAEVSAASEGQQREAKTYQEALGSNFFDGLAYGTIGGPTMNLPGGPEESSIAGQALATVFAENYYCNQARQNALRAAAAQ